MTPPQAHRDSSNTSARASACCDSILLDRCCPPAEKPACCGLSVEASTCGCQNGAAKR